MDREEVTKWLTIMKANLNTFPEVSSEKKIEALGEAVRLLKNEESIDCDNTDCNNCVKHKYCDYETTSSGKPNKSENPTSSDCVDRHSVDLLAYRYLKEPTDNHMAFYEDFLDLPSVVPIRPKGHWDIKDNMWWVCSACGCQTRMMKKYNVPRFCPACGADMRGEENERL